MMYTDNIGQEVNPGDAIVYSPPYYKDTLHIGILLRITPSKRASIVRDIDDKNNPRLISAREAFVKIKDESLLTDHIKERLKKIRKYYGNTRD